MLFQAHWAKGMIKLARIQYPPNVPEGVELDLRVTTGPDLALPANGASSSSGAVEGSGQEDCDEAKAGWCW